MFIHHHVDEILAGVASFGVTTALVHQAPIELDHPPSWVPYIVSLIGPVLVLVANRVLSSKAARKRAAAEWLREEAKMMLEDGDKSNDAAARKMLREARELEADATALDGVSTPKKGE